MWFETLREPTLERTIGLMAKRGRIVLMAGRDAHPEFPLGRFYTSDMKMLGFAMFNATPDEQRECANHLNYLFESGQWKPNVSRTLSLDEAAESHRIQEDNTLQGEGRLAGKIVLEV
ncbi:MAG: zinc-binding dehydrogenase [Vicinamibacterales bacterium]